MPRTLGLAQRDMLSPQWLHFSTVDRPQSARTVRAQSLPDEDTLPTRCGSGNLLSLSKQIKDLLGVAGCE